MKKPIPKSVIGLDIGIKRIGLAGCDPLGITVSRLKCIKRGNFEDDLEIFKDLCNLRNPLALIVGLPLDMKGRETKQSNITRKYAKKLSEALDLPVIYINEHSSSIEARERLNLYNDRSGKIDSESAAILVEQWLNEGPDI
tara:strand:- start:1094 stop:1516 length:423 start_codon:yes stop_codon:yes gene_type:complete